MAEEIEDAEEFLAHFGVKGMKWGRRKSESESSGPSERQTKRAEYKKNLASGQEKVKKRQYSQLSNAERKAIKTRANRETVAGLAIAAGIVAAPYAAESISRGLGNLSALAVAKNTARAAQDKAAADSLIRGVGNLSTYVLREGANGSWH